MKKSWAVTLTVEVEYQYLPNQFGLMTVMDERLVEGDDEFCDALWATEQAKLFLKDRLNNTIFSFFRPVSFSKAELIVKKR